MRVHDSSFCSLSLPITSKKRVTGNLIYRGKRVPRIQTGANERGEMVETGKLPGDRDPEERRLERGEPWKVQMEETSGGWKFYKRRGGIGNRSSRGIFEDGNKGRRQTRNRCHLCSDLEPTATRETWAFKYLAEWREYPHWIYEFTLTAVYQLTVL